MNRRRISLAAFFAAANLLLAQDAPPSIQISGAVNHSLTLTASDLAKMPRATVRTKSDGVDVAFEGVWLHEILKRAGLPELRGKGLASYLLAEAKDGYQALFSLAEIDPAFTDNQVLLADSADGKPLFGAQGPFRLVAPRTNVVPAPSGCSPKWKLSNSESNRRMQARVQNQLASVRKGRGVTASDLARRVGVSRQTIYAIEAGTYVPNTEVTLRLARELEVTVESLFSLHAESALSPHRISSEVLSPTPPAKGQPVQVCQIGSGWVSIPVSAAPYYLPEADGVIAKVGRSANRADLMIVGKDESAQKRLILAGCDPATNLLARMVERISGVEIVPAPASSKLALTWLRQGKVHIAGSHLQDAESGDFNLPFLKREFPGEDFCVVTFARWEEGFVVTKGNPKSVRKIEDLTKAPVRFVNREAGSGSRGLLDQLLGESGVPKRNVKGYDRIAYGHLAAAYHIASDEADCCLATRSAAQTFGLDFVPLRTERYDLVLLRKTLDLPGTQAFLDVLQRATLRRKLEMLAGYDTSQTGVQLA